MVKEKTRRKLEDALKRVVVIGATMALTLGMAAPATTELAAGLAGEVARYIGWYNSERLKMFPG